MTTRFVVTGASRGLGAERVRQLRDRVARVYHTNVVGPALLAKALLPVLRRGRKIVANMSSSLGSLAVSAGGFS